MNRIFSLLAVIIALICIDTSLDAQSLLSVTMVDSAHGFAVGSSGTILATTTGGASWVSQTSGTSLTLESISMVDANTGWTVGSNAFGSDIVLKTTNGGTSWVSQSIGISVPDLHCVRAGNANRVIIVGKSATLGGLILRTTNGGSSWSSVSSVGTNPFYGVTSTDSNTFYAVGWAGATYKSTDGGATWASKFTSPTDIFESVAFLSSTAGVIVGSAGPTTGVIYVTTDGGANWTQKMRGGGAELYSVSYPASATIFANGAYGILQKSTNTGQTWISQTQPATENSFTSALNGVIVGSVTSILRTTDGGSSWSSNSGGSSPCSSAPSVPTLLTPASGSTGMSTSPTFTWSAASCATTRYHIQIYNGATLAKEDSSLIAPTYTASSLSTGVTYTWKVSAADSAGSSGYSSPWNFTTSSNTVAISITPDTLNFGIVKVGSSNTKTYNVSNSGTGTLSVPQVISSSVKFTAKPSSFSLAGGGTQKVTITYKASSEVSDTAGITFIHNASGGSTTKYAVGTGTRGRVR